MAHLRLLLLLLVSWAQGPGFAVERADASVSADTVATVDRLTAAAVDRLTPYFPGLSPGPFRVLVHRTEASVPEDVRAAVHEGAAGVALLSTSVIHLILDRMELRPPNDLRTTVDHEVAHILLHHHAGAAGPHVPRWFHEGLAQVLSGHTYLGVSEEDIVFHALAGRLLFFSKLRQRFPARGDALRTAYAQSFSFVSFLMRRLGLPILLEAAQQCGPKLPFDEAYRAVVGEPLVVMESEWNEYLKTGSGARWRVLLTSCFGLTMVVFLPVLVLAGKRRWDRDHRSRRKLEAEEEQQP